MGTTGKKKLIRSMNGISRRRSFWLDGIRQVLREGISSEILITGNFEYTKDMAIRDLIGGGVRYDTERVQTSNISNQPERIAILSGQWLCLEGKAEDTGRGSEI